MKIIQEIKQKKLMNKRDFTTEYKWWQDSEKKVKLEQAFAIGCTDKEACSYAEITEAQLYYYEDVIDKQFRVKKQELKEKPILKAKQTIVKNLDNPDHAKWYLERKKKDEFSHRTELTGENGGAIITTITGMQIIKDEPTIQDKKPQAD